ncbi:Xaa-Arg dipeptidase [Cladobotryum mycophilum]|uniref:Xaa-Arg dipeptidase n=1 Tax=Cladobotryum mycophilum TaxID=491253 RepID=A0ABR0SQQ2_9HYPO
MLLNTFTLAGLFLARGCWAVGLENLPSLLKNISADIYPDLKDIAVDIWEHPEIGLAEFYAHDLIVDYFTNKKPGEWQVTPHAHGMPTAWQLDFEYRPSNTPADAEIPVIGILAEYDALVHIDHACGHNHICLNSLALASLVRQSVIDLGLPVQLRVVGCPDEENGAGKHTLLEAGAFDDIALWIFAHPANANGVVAMDARLNVVADFKGATHSEAVGKAYQGMLQVRDLDSAHKWPGTSSTATPVEDVGMFICNVVQDNLSLGIKGSTPSTVNETIGSILATNIYPNVSCTVSLDAAVTTGVNLTCTGIGGHASADTNGPLVAFIETYRALSTNPSVSFYLPGNMTYNELDVTFDLRTRYTQDMSAVGDAVIAAISDLAAKTSTDVLYPSLEITPTLPQMLIDLVALPDYGSQSGWLDGSFTAASTDAGWVQGAVVDNTTHALLRSDRAVFQPFWDLCEPGGLCANNHEDLYRLVANTDYSYERTEIMARAMAHLTIEIINDPILMANVTAITRA